MSENNRPRYSIHVDTLVRAPVHEVWGLLVDPVRLGELFWGSTVESDFSVGSSIVWKGVWEGKPFEDGGQILKREEGSLLPVSIGARHPARLTTKRRGASSRSDSARKGAGSASTSSTKIS